jgi:hypothetical protein
MPAIVTFELNASAPNVIVEISTGGDNTINALEIFSEWKQWLLDGPPSLLGLPQAFTVLGGEPKTQTTEQGQAFFMHSPDWVFRPAELDHKLTIVGDIGVLGGIGSFLVPTLGGFTVLVELERSSLITGLPFLDVAVSTRAAAGDAMALTAPAEAAIADAVWDEPPAAHVGAGTFGELQAALATLAAQQIALVREIHRLRGLDPANPAVIDEPGNRLRVPADGSLIDQTIVTVSGVTTVTRQ